MTVRDKLNQMTNLEIAIYMMSHCKCEDCPAKREDCAEHIPARCVDNWCAYLESEIVKEGGKNE